MTLTTRLRTELRAVTFPIRRRTRFGLHALANDALVRVGKPAKFEETYAEQWARILGQSGDLPQSVAEVSGPRVLFGTMFGASFPTRAIDSVIAMGLRLRGIKPLILSCDLALPGCEWNVYGTSGPPTNGVEASTGRYGREYPCKACMLKLDESHQLPGLERVALSSFVRPGDVARAEALASGVELRELRDFSYRELNVGEHAYASLLRALMRGIPEDDEPTRWIARRLLASAIVLTDAGDRLFDAVRPDRFVAGEVYLTAGPLCELARRRGIHVVVHGQPYRKQTIWLSHDESYHRALINEKNDRWQQFDMSVDRTRVADDYLKSKHFVARDYTTYHVDSIQDETQIRAELGFDDRPIISLFTNVLWDAQLYYRFNVFPTMLDWLYETIRFFEKRTDLQLAIRVHPAEAPGGLPTNQPLLPELERRFPTLPKNVALVRPESKVSSYVLGTMSTAALVYGARMGVELVMLGTPVVVAGEAFMRGKGFTIDPATKDEYFSILDRGASIPKPADEERARARRWYYFYFFRMMMPFPFYAVERSGTEALVRLSFESLVDLLPGRSPVLDLVCRGILDGSTPFEWDEFDGDRHDAATA